MGIEGFGLEGRVAIVTGSGRGIGHAVARALVLRGANVVVNDLDAERAEQAAAELGSAAIALPADVSKAGEVDQLVQGACSAFGRIDILVNNAGIDRAASIFEIDETEWDHLIAVNLKSAFLCSKAVLPVMIERGWGRIVNLSSVVARQGALNGGIHYATSKAGLLGFTRTLARQMARHGITVNAVAPGVVDTDLIRENVRPEVRQRLIEAIPLGRLADPEDVANLIAFLVCEQASYITGATFDINGGFWMG